MKKILVTLSLLVGLSVLAQQRTHISSPFLACDSVYVGSVIVGVTNLNSPLGRATNIISQVYTNLAGTKVTVAAGNTENLFWDVDLVPYEPAPYVTNYTVYDGAYNTNTYALSYGGENANISITYCPGAVATNTTFVFVTLPDGVNESTDTWVVSPYASATLKATTSYNVPAWRWPGVRKLRLREITSGTALHKTNTVLSVMYNAWR